MKSTPTSIFAHAFYMMCINGLGLMLFPSLILDLFGFAHGELVWSFRMIGVLAFALGVYYYQIAKHQIVALYSWSAWLRYFAAGAMVVMWIVGEVEWMILLFAAVDSLGATWTWWTLGFRRK